MVHQSIGARLNLLRAPHRSRAIVTPLYPFTTNLEEVGGSSWLPQHCRSALSRYRAGNRSVHRPPFTPVSLPAPGRPIVQRPAMPSGSDGRRRRMAVLLQIARCGTVLMWAGWPAFVIGFFAGPSASRGVMERLGFPLLSLFALVTLLLVAAVITQA